jgi:hypothetical protein
MPPFMPKRTAAQMVKLRLTRNTVAAKVAHQVSPTLHPEKFFWLHDFVRFIDWMDGALLERWGRRGVDPEDAGTESWERNEAVDTCPLTCGPCKGDATEAEECRCACQLCKMFMMSIFSFLT